MNTIDWFGCYLVRACLQFQFLIRWGNLKLTHSKHRRQIRYAVVGLDTLPKLPCSRRSRMRGQILNSRLWSPTIRRN